MSSLPKPDDERAICVNCGKEIFTGEKYVTNLYSWFHTFNHNALCITNGNLAITNIAAPLEEPEWW